MKIEKFLSNKEIVSRSKSKKYIKENVIKVNDELVKKSINLLDGDIVTINNIKYTYNEYVYFIINKPAGYICANSDQLNPVIFELIDKEDFQKDLFTIGRLDKDTTGLLIITNNGKIAHKIINGKKEIKKTYFVVTEKQIDDAQINQLEEGVIILDGYKTKKAIVEKVDDYKINLTITEGKYHQVKEMLKSVNNKVAKLSRVKIENYELPKNLYEGQYIKLTKQEIINILKLS